MLMELSKSNRLDVYLSNGYFPSTNIPIKLMPMLQEIICSAAHGIKSVATHCISFLSNAIH